MKIRHLVYFVVLLALTFGVLIGTGKATGPNVLRRCFTWACWILVYFTFVPLAARKHRSVGAWFWLGAASFWGPYALVFLGGVLAAHAGRTTIEGFGLDFKSAIGYVVFLAFVASLIGLRLTARYLRHLPDLSQSSQQDDEP